MTNGSATHTDILAELRPSQFRFGMTLVAIAAMGAILTSTGLFNADVDIRFRVLAVLSGAGLVFLATRVIRQGRSGVQLTPEGLFEIDGRKICALNDIENVDRGFAAFRPSTGFSVRLKNRHDLAWSLGLWWRFGKTVGVGGITPPAAGRVMANALATALKARDLDEPAD